MITIEISNTIKVNGISKELYNKLRSRLTYPNPNYIKALKHSKNKYAASRMPKTLKSYKTSKGYLILPRGFYLELRDILEMDNLEYRVLNKIPKFDRIESEQNIELRPYQTDMVDDLECYYGYNCMAKAPPGTGKTFLGMEFARRQGLKTLWLVHNDRLFKQAIDSACTVFRITKEEVGIIRGKTSHIGKQITVGMFQTLIRKDIVDLGIHNIFGIVIVDEVHHAPSRTWSWVINHFNCLLVLGLTATPRRNDGLTPLLFDYMGPIVTIANKQLLLESGILVPVEYCPFSTDIEVHGKTFKDIETRLTENVRRNLLLRDIIHQEYEENENNYIIVLTSRRKHVETLHNLCLESGIPALKMLGGYKNKKEEARIEQELNSKRCRVMAATFNYLSEGFDYPPLSRVIIGIPFRDDVRLEQSVGRSQRPTSTKLFSRIIDLVDSNTMLYDQFKSRNQYAIDLDLDIKTYNLREQ